MNSFAVISFTVLSVVLLAVRAWSAGRRLTIGLAGLLWSESVLTAAATAGVFTVLFTTPPAFAFLPVLVATFVAYLLLITAVFMIRRRQMIPARRVTVGFGYITLVIPASVLGFIDADVYGLAAVAAIIGLIVSGIAYTARRRAADLTVPSVSPIEEFDLDFWRARPASEARGSGLVGSRTR